MRLPDRHNVSQPETVYGGGGREALKPHPQRARDEEPERHQPGRQGDLLKQRAAASCAADDGCRRGQQYSRRKAGAAVGMEGHLLFTCLETQQGFANCVFHRFAGNSPEKRETPWVAQTAQSHARVSGCQQMNRGVLNGVMPSRLLQDRDHGSGRHSRLCLQERLRRSDHSLDGQAEIGVDILLRRAGSEAVKADRCAAGRIIADPAFPALHNACFNRHFQRVGRQNLPPVFCRLRGEQLPAWKADDPYRRTALGQLLRRRVGKLQFAATRDEDQRRRLRIGRTVEKDVPALRRTVGSSDLNSGTIEDRQVLPRKESTR